MELDWSGPQIVAALEQPFKETNELLGRNMQKQITDNKWSWPSSPSPRDIVDTGRLRQSYQPFPQGLAYEHSYNVEYALAVHEGAMLANGGSLPARPWIRVALREFGFAKVFEKLAQAKLDRIR